MLFARIAILCALSLAGWATPTAQVFARDQPDALQSVTAIQANDLVIRVKVPRKASPADVAWLVLEFENKGKVPLIVDNAHYRIESERDDLLTGKLNNSGSLASGNTYDLFPHAWKTTPVSPIVLQPEDTYRVVNQPSDYSSTLLGLPPRGGFRVRAQFHLSLQLKNGPTLTTPPTGIPFTCEWLYPDEAGFTAMRGRLKKLLQAPEDKAHHAYILGTHLGIPEVAKAVTLDELLTALTPRKGSFDGRDAIAKHLARHFAGDAAVSNYYLERLRARDVAALSDLRATNLWNKSFVEPLVDAYVSNPSRFGHALHVLHAHRSDWARDTEIARRLSAAARKSTPWLEKKLSDMNQEELERWSRAAGELAMTGDRAMIADLRPALADRRRCHTGLSATAWLPLERPPPVRVCDVALEAILTLLDGSPDAAYRGADVDAVRKKPRGEYPAAFEALRDKMIAELQQRLTAEDKKREQ